MSRSYRKFPVFKDSPSKSRNIRKGISPKTFANRAVRRYPEIPRGKAGYKKLYCSYMICDYRFYECRTEKRFKALWENGEYFWFGDTYTEALEYWKKCYLRK